MRLKKVLPVLLLLPLLLIRIESRDAPKAKASPNVVLIVADCIGYGDIGPHGVSDIRTPGLDRMAREGVRLTDAYSAAPICSPSRSSLLTGRYSQRFGVELNIQNTKDSVGTAVHGEYAWPPSQGRRLRDRSLRQVASGL